MWNFPGTENDGSLHVATKKHSKRFQDVEFEVDGFLHYLSMFRSAFLEILRPS